MVPFPSLNVHGPWSSQLFWLRWAWVGQVDLVLTKIGHYLLLLGFKITDKVLGNEYLEETAV